MKTPFIVGIIAVAGVSMFGVWFRAASRRPDAPPAVTATRATSEPQPVAARSQHRDVSTSTRRQLLKPLAAPAAGVRYEVPSESQLPPSATGSIRAVQRWNRFITRSHVTPEQQQQIIQVFLDAQENYRIAGAADSDAILALDRSFLRTSRSGARYRTAATHQAAIDEYERHPFFRQIYTDMGEDIGRRLQTFLTPDQLKEYDNTWAAGGDPMTRALFTGAFQLPVKILPSSGTTASLAP